MSRVIIVVYTYRECILQSNALRSESAIPCDKMFRMHPTSISNCLQSVMCHLRLADFLKMITEAKIILGDALTILSIQSGHLTKLLEKFISASKF